MREYFNALFGNGEAKARIGNSIERGTLPHAYIIEGPDGSGKKLFSHLIAAALSCKQKDEENTPLPCMECESCRKIMSDNYPDVFFLSRGDRASISVDSVREMKADMFLSAAESQYKVYIIDDAHLMLAPAQNALLKVLEEPPKNVIILLLCETTDTILSTIKSRTQLIRMSLFSCEDIKSYLLSHNKNAQALQNKSKDEFSAAILNASGSIGRASLLVNPKESASILKERKCIDKIIKTITEKSSFSDFRDAFAALSTKRTELYDEFETLYSAIRDLILIKKDENATLLYYYDKETAQAISSKIGIQKLFSVSDSIFCAMQDLSVNANVGILISSLINELQK